MMPKEKVRPTEKRGASASAQGEVAMSVTTTSPLHALSIGSERAVS
jgi:hypothetical protein